MRSATPQLSKKVAEETEPAVQNNRAKLIISMRPSLITAAFVLSPKPNPSQKPAPTATMFFRAPQISTTSASCTTVTRK